MQAASTPSVVTLYDTPRQGMPQESIELLLLEDSTFDATAIARNCSRTGLPIKVTVAEDLRTFRVVVRNGRFDMAFIDYDLPEGNGLTARDILRQSPSNADVPMVMITSVGRHDVAVAALKSGILDYVTKDHLDPDAVRDLVLRATDLPAHRQPEAMPSVMPADMLTDRIRQVLREELADLRDPALPLGSQLAMTLIGLNGQGIAVPDFAAMLEDDEAAFIFKTYSN